MDGYSLDPEPAVQKMLSALSSMVWYEPQMALFPAHERRGR